MASVSRRELIMLPFKAAAAALAAKLGLRETEMPAAISRGSHLVYDNFSINAAVVRRATAKQMALEIDRQMLMTSANTGVPLKDLADLEWEPTRTIPEGSAKFAVLLGEKSYALWDIKPSPHWPMEVELENGDTLYFEETAHYQNPCFEDNGEDWS